jgi:hypothetical protein
VDYLLKGEIAKEIAKGELTSRATDCWGWWIWNILKLKAVLKRV